MGKGQAKLEKFLKKNPEWLDPCYHGFRDYNTLYVYLDLYPKLAKVRFDDSFPLTYMLAASACYEAPLEWIQKVYEMYPNVMTIPDSMGNFILHDALIYQCSYKVIDFLLKKNSFALIAKTMDGKLPMHYLVDSFLSKSNDRCLDEGYWREFTKKFRLLYNAHHPNFWQQNRSESESILSQLMDSPKTPLWLLDWLGMKQGMHNPKFTINAADMHNLQKLALRINNLRHFVPHLTRCNEIIIQDKGKNHRRRHRQCEGFLWQFFSNVRNIPPTLTIHLQNMRISPLCGFVEFTKKDWVYSPVQEIKLTNCTFWSSPNNNINVAGKYLMRTFQYLPNLRRLSLDFYDESEDSWVTDEVVELIEKGHLERLTITGNVFVIEDKAKLLKAIHNLQPPQQSVTFVMWSNFRDSLYVYMATPKSERDRKIPSYNYDIAYQSFMCQNRPKITAPNATSKQLIDCLCSVPQQGELYHQPRCSKRVLLVESVWYELLREVPDLWSHSSCDSIAAASSSSSPPQPKSLLPLPETTAASRAKNATSCSSTEKEKKKKKQQKRQATNYGEHLLVDGGSSQQQQSQLPPKKKKNKKL